MNLHAEIVRVSCISVEYQGNATVQKSVTLVYDTHFKLWEHLGSSATSSHQGLLEWHNMFLQLRLDYINALSSLQKLINEQNE